MVRSSVLGGEVITRLDGAGNKSKTIVKVDGLLTAVQQQTGTYSSVQWAHTDPAGVSEVTNYSGNNKSIYDPLGNYISFQNVPTSPVQPSYYGPPTGGPGSLFGFNGSSTHVTCTWDNLPVDCNKALHALRNGIVWNCGPAGCGPRNNNGELVPLNPATGGWERDAPREPKERIRRDHDAMGIDREPQNSLKPMSRAEISSWTDNILNLFKDHPGCEEWTNKLLAKMAESSGFSAGSIRDILENFRNNGTIYTDGSGKGVGTGSGGTGTKLTGFPAISLGYGGTTEDTAETLLHEIIHWAGMPAKGGGYADYYNDVAMAGAWNKLDVVISVDDYRRMYPEAVAKYEADYEAAYGVKGMAYLETRLALAAGRATCLNKRNGLSKLP